MFRRFFCYALAAISLALVACADAEPDVLIATGSMVLDFAAEDALPTTRLAVFLQMESEAQRADVFFAEHKETGFHWRVSSPWLFKNGDKQWVCYTNLQPPENHRIPTGVYEFQYVDAAGNDTQGTFLLSYAESLLAAKASDVKGMLGTSTDSIALYDKNGVLIYFGKRKNNWRSNANILRDQKNAVTMRHCLSADSNRVVCLLPPEPLVEPPKEPTAGAEHD